MQCQCKNYWPQHRDEAKVYPLVHETQDILLAPNQPRDTRYPHCPWVCFHACKHIRSRKADSAGAGSLVGWVIKAGRALPL